MKLNLKYSKIFVIFLLIILINSCLSKKEKICLSIKKAYELTFHDSMLQEICFSPFDEGKIWVRISNKNYDVIEIDKLTGQKVTLDPQKSKYFYSENGYNNYFHKDQYDSIVWIGGPNRNVKFYDQSTNTFTELPVNYVSRIISKPDKVFFVSLRGFCYWDRKSKSINQVDGVPIEFIHSSEMPNDTVIILDAKYTYNFNTGEVKKGIYMFGDVNKGEWNSYKANNGYGLLALKDSLFYLREGIKKIIPLPSKVLENTEIINGKYWQLDGNHFYSFDPELNKLEKYNYRLPKVNNHSIKYEIDDRYIWILRSSQVMLISLKDKKQLEFQIKPEENHLATIFDDCNVYSVYKNKVTLASKNDFIKQCIEFDSKKFDLDIKKFDLVIDSIGILKETNSSISLAKLNYLKNRYSNVKNIEIRNKLEEMDLRAFQSNVYEFPKGFIACYTDNLIPIAQRKSCIISLIDHYVRSSEFEKVIKLKKDFIKFFGKSKEGYSISQIDSVEVYLTKLNKLNKAKISEDSLYYLKALALESICNTQWYCDEGCGGCNFSLVTDKIKSFQLKFPSSMLYDDSELYLIEKEYIYAWDDESIIAMNRAYEKFLKKYPDSDKKSDVLYSIFNNLISLQDLNKEKIKYSAMRFIKESKNNKEIEEVKQRLIDFEIK
jgi:hypothetical protein